MRGKIKQWIFSNKMPGNLVSIVIISGLMGYAFLNNILLSDGTSLKIGVISDWEFGDQKKVGNKLTNQAMPELEKVVQYLNEEFKPEIIIAGFEVNKKLGKFSLWPK